MRDHMVWVDLEMTGLDPATDVILEIALLVTDAQLQPLDDGIDLVLHATDEQLAGMLPVVQEMHAKSGLTEVCRTSAVTLEEAQAAALEAVKRHVADPRLVPLCGSSIATDRTFLSKYMPDLDQYLHYRMIDVSSLKELARRWHPAVHAGAPVKTGGHRAMGDIRDSIAELAYYRDALFLPPPPAAAAETVSEALPDAR